MLGYLTDKKDYFKGNLLEFNLKKGISYSGGTNQHYNFFKGILNYSIINKDSRTPLHDIKAGQFSLYLFPLKVQCILSILYYAYEQNLLIEFKNSPLHINNILLPSEQLQYNSIVTNSKLSSNLLNLLDDTALNNNNLDNVLTYLNITKLELDLYKNSLLNNLETILRFFNTNAVFIEDYTQIIKNNDRLKTILIASKTLNYKPQSSQYLTEALIIWQQTSNI